MKYPETRKFNLLIPVAVPPNLENREYQERGPYNMSQINDRAPPFLRHPGKKASRCPSYMLFDPRPLKPRKLDLEY